MENIKNIAPKLLNIFVISGLTISISIFAYDQDNTHPALTDEIVDFYNLSFPNDFISDEFKKELIRGVVEEDTELRPLNHFYDPIYNKGFASYYTSKEWARSSEIQYASLINYAAIFEVTPSSLDNTSYGDYSYERAIKDYAMGDKMRAFRALGHVLHLLEDANVPDHTRDDPHPPIHSIFGSPYEKEMAKWSPLNTNIAKSLFDKRTKPVILSSTDKYFDEVALYSNNNFFSEDTIFTNRYQDPVIVRKINKEEDGLMYRFGLGRDREGTEYFLVRYGFSTWRNIVTEQDFTVDSRVVLDDYWARLSKHLIPHGAGLVRLFLTQAEAAEKLYNARKVEESKLSIIERFISAINPFDSSENVVEQNDQIATEIVSLVLSGQTPISSPSPTSPIQPLVSLPQISPTPLPIQLPKLSPTPTITPTSSPTPSVSPTTTPNPTVSPSPTPTTESSSCSEPVLKTNDPLRKVVINEIVWMGTEASTADEWLELKNNTGQEINLNCWQIIAEDGTPKIRLTSKIGANGLYLLERTDDNTIKDVVADQIYTGALGNSGEILKLYDKDGNLQDVVGHKDTSGAIVPWYFGDNTTKSSMERRNSNTSGADSSSWQTNDGITKNGQDSAGNQIRGTPKYQNSTGTLSLGGGFTGGGGSSLSSSDGNGGVGGTAESNGGGGTGDSSGGSVGDSETPLFKVVINEIAWAGTGADASDEWIEIYNPSSQSINIGGWTLKSFKIKDGILASDSPDIVFATKSLDPFSYFLLERTADTTISDIAADQIYTGALDNGGEILELRDLTGQLQDKVGHLVASASVSSWYAGENNTSTTPATRKTMERIGDSWQTNNGIIRNGLDKNGNLLFGTPKKKTSEEYSSVLENSVWPMFGLNQNHTGQVLVNGPNNASISWQYDFTVSDPLNNLPFQPVISASSSIYIIHTNSGGNGNLSVISETGQLEWKWPQSGTYTLSIKSIPAILADKSVYMGVVNSVYAVVSPAVDKWNICTASFECNGLKAGPITIDSKGNSYFSDENQNFQAVRSDGTLKWKINFLTTYSTNVFVFFGQAPVIDENTNTLYLAATTTSGLPSFFAFDLNTGLEKWRTVWSDTGTSITSHISFDKADNRLYAAARNNILEINPANGQISAFPAASVSDAFDRQPKSLISIDSVNNALLIGFDYYSLPIASSSNTSDKILLDTKTKIFSFDKAAKTKNWAYEIPLNLAGNMITVDNLGNLYFAAEDIGVGTGKLYSLDKDGALRWEMNGGAPSQGTHPVIDSGKLYQVFGFKLYKVGF